MRIYWELLVTGTLLACASNNTPPPASSATVAEASSTRTTDADFAPVSNDGMAAAAADAHSAKPAAAHEQRDHLDAISSSAPNNAPRATDNNVATLPPQAQQPSPPDNSRVNARDRGESALTPMDQGPSEGDRKITQQIRQAVVRDGTLSFTAKNVKIITINGKVTLRGPVKSAGERSAIEAAAKNVAGVSQVDNQLDVKN